MTSPAPVDYLAAEGPHGDLFPRLTSPEQADPYRLSDEQVAHFRANGFAPRVPILSPAQLDHLREGLEDIVHGRNGRESELIGSSTDPTPGSSKLTYMQGAWMIDEAIHDLVFHPAITVKLTQLLDTPRVRFFHDQVFYKPPKSGGNVAWHQDYSYWTRTVPSAHITVWIGLDDSTTENGCLHVVPGTHRWGLLDMPDLTGDMEKLLEMLTPEQRAEWNPVPVEQPAGTCSFHHDHTVHGSYPNRSERPRRAIILNYMADGVASGVDGNEVMPGFRTFDKGEQIKGNWFPLAIDLDALG